MTRVPVHQIEVVHEWVSPRTSETRTGRFETIQTCKDCGEEQHILDLDAIKSGPKLRDVAQGRASVLSKEPAIGLQSVVGDIARHLKDMDDLMFGGTAYDSLNDFAITTSLRHEGAVQAGEITFRLAKHLVRAGYSGKKFRRKILLAFRQGLVCNRCDMAVYSLNQLTEDHIQPRANGGQSKLLNLQLLCLPCNALKGDGEPRESDKSPFSYEGKPCVHRLTCGEIAMLRT